MSKIENIVKNIQDEKYPWWVVMIGFALVWAIAMVLDFGSGFCWMYSFDLGIPYAVACDSRNYSFLWVVSEPRGKWIQSRTYMRAQKHKEKKIMLINDIKTWKDYRGKKELLKHLSGGSLTLKQAVMAMCYSCNAGYFDGRIDCETPDCPLYGHMPYRKEKIKRVRSEKQIEVSKKSHFGREKATRKHHSSNSDV